MLTAELLASAHHGAALPDAEPLPSLDAVLRAVCRKPPRRIDRFVQLALIGSARCVQGVQLRPDCGIYLGSTHGPLASNIRVQQQMLRDRCLPKPFDFVNTLGSIAGFYVADNLQLSGPSLFVSRQTRCLEAVLEIALTDLAVGAVRQALVGVVEEAPSPLADQRQRLRVANAATPLGEGSHWMLLGASRPGVARRSLGLQRFVDGAALTAVVAAQAGLTATPGLGRALGSDTAQALRRNYPHAVDIANVSMPFHDSLEAAWFVDRVASAASADTMLINGEHSDCCLLTVVTQGAVD